MGEIKRIMVAIAFSKYSEDIFEYATKLATAFNAQLVVANVINIRDVEAVSSVQSMGYNVDTDEYIKGVKDDRTALLDQIVKTVSFPKEKVKIIFKVGHPFDQLMKIILEEEIDMIVMGPKGRTDLQHVLVGSIAERIFHHCPIPVVSFRTK